MSAEAAFCPAHGRCTVPSESNPLDVGLCSLAQVPHACPRCARAPGGGSRPRTRLPVTVLPAVRWWYFAGVIAPILRPEGACSTKCGQRAPHAPPAPPRHPTTNLLCLGGPSLTPLACARCSRCRSLLAQRLSEGVTAAKRLLLGREAVSTGARAFE